LATTKVTDVRLNMMLFTLWVNCQRVNIIGYTWVHQTNLWFRHFIMNF